MPIRAARSGAVLPEGTSFNPFIATGGWGASIDDFHTNWDFRPRQAGLYRRLLHLGRRFAWAADHLPSGAARYAALGLSLEARHRQMVPGPLAIGASGMVLPNRYNTLDLDPTYKNRSPTADAHDVRLQGERAEDEPALRRGHRPDRRTMNPTIMGAPTPRLTWNVVPYQSTHNHRRRHHGHRSRRQRAQQVSAELGRPQRVRDGASAFPHNSATTRPGRLARSHFGWRMPSARSTSKIETAGLIMQNIRSRLAMLLHRRQHVRLIRRRRPRIPSRAKRCSRTARPAIRSRQPECVGRRSMVCLDANLPPRSSPIPDARVNVIWTPELLDTYLADPQGGVFRGNRMPFSGMPEAQARTDLIAI